MRPEHRDRETALKYIYHCEAHNGEDLRDYQEFLLHFGHILNTSYCHALCFGTLKNMYRIDKIIEGYTNNWKISRMTAIDRSLLRMSVYELLYHNTPRKVVLDEAVELAKRYGTQKSKAFINGVLHSIAQQTRTADNTGETDVCSNE
ncbi:MAG: transcription antitermination factor NusB [Pseudomonadota bacterium]|nr:transcription antitermination factor NusB [Pseudomonadota bacterium]